MNNKTQTFNVQTLNAQTLNINLAATQPSATYQMLDKIAAKKQNGIEVLSLCAGEPDFDTPAHISEAGIDAIKAGKTRYTPVAGLRELREAVAQKFISENKIATTWQNTLVSSGGKQIIFNALAATLNPGDEVIIPAPYWVSYPEIVNICGAIAKIVACDRDTHFKLTATALENAITDKTRWLILNSPSNPTGAVYSADELSALAEVLRRYPKILVLCDDIYEHLMFDEQDFYTLAQVTKDLNSRILTMNGASKGFAMTGWRIGYCTGPLWLIQAMTKLQGQQTSGACSISQHATLAALTQPNAFLQDVKRRFQTRRDYLVTQINQIEGLQCHMPAGAFYVFVNCENWLGRSTPTGKTLQTDADVADALLDESHVGVMHGSAFGLGPYLRISFASSQKMLEKACVALKHFSASLT